VHCEIHNDGKQINVEMWKGENGSDNTNETNIDAREKGKVMN
jgi:hypothetical protein